jgi:uncharacterized protein YbbC (DUF1343 family)
MVSYGVDHIEAYASLLSGGRVALLTSITGRNSRNEATIDVLGHMCRLTALLGPEHGVRGDQAAGALTGDYTDPATLLPVFSLYSPAGKRLRPEILDAFDILVYDIQDVGLRFYTFLSTLCNMVEDCAAAGKRLVVLDRPNPLGGRTVEGGILRDEYRSFVGCRPVPVRYGLTAGEFARMVNEKEKLGCDLHVVPCAGWRGESFPGWGQPIWQMPSLGLPTFEGTALYAGTCLFEGTALSEGRGTAAPFRIIGGPGVDAEQLVREFTALNLPGAAATPVYFVPSASKHQGTACGGLMLHVTDFEVLRPVTLGVKLVDLFQRLYPEQSAFLPPVEPGRRPFISLLTGCGDFVPGWDIEAVLARWEEESDAFAREKAAYHLYERD